jgi:hypothetical protein
MGTGWTGAAANPLVARSMSAAMAELRGNVNLLLFMETNLRLVLERFVLETAGGGMRAKQG